MYQAAEIECWSCGRRIKVYTWPGHETWAKKSPEEGRPATVKLVHSHTIEDDYWANVCEGCGRIQGDWFLYDEPEGPFFGLEES